MTDKTTQQPAPIQSAELAELRKVLTKVREDINWMLNSQQFLNPFVFKYLDDALAAAPSIASQRQVSAGEWQPIESAPKDGTTIRLLVEFENYSSDGLTEQIGKPIGWRPSTATTNSPQESEV